MRKFAFQELAYAIVVAAAYGLVIGIYITGATARDPQIIDLILFSLPQYIILWIILICLHLAGIYLLVRLEEQQGKTRRDTSSEKKSE
ncbi:MAG: hypothetical protein ACFFB2_02210 [Promethearchaeota archaeon]